MTTETEKAEQQKAEDTRVDELKKTQSNFDQKLTGDDVAAGDNAYSDDNPEKKTAIDENTDAKGEVVNKNGEGESDELEIDEALEARIEAAGLTQEEVEKFDSVEALEKTLDIIEARSEKKPVEKTKEEIAAEQKAIEEANKPYSCGLDPEVYDQGVIKAIDSLGNTLLTELKTLKAENETLKAHNVEQIRRKNTEWFDSKIASLGEAYEDIFGKGTIDDMDVKSTVFKNRAKLDVEIKTLRRGYLSSGRAIPSNDKLFDMALSIAFKNKQKQVALEPTKKKLQARASQTIGKGSSAVNSADTALSIQRKFDKLIDGE